MKCLLILKVGAEYNSITIFLPGEFCLLLVHVNLAALIKIRLSSVQPDLDQSYLTI